jgi:acetylornithine deacetylase/succinyl-diaminopimelate desuccinylase-like protein
MFDRQAIEEYIKQNRANFEQQLVDLLSIPSVSADPQQAIEVTRAGQWVADRLTSLGLATELASTAGHPIIFAQSPEIPGRPTVLVYGHYDVQPPDPLDEWLTPPFEPTIRDGNVVARGATDDKGQMLTHINSLEAWVRTHDKLPIQLKYLIEGEEEVGSENIEPFLVRHRDALACDVVVVSDTSQFAPGQPAITYGLRGIAYYQLNLEGPGQDLHSGTFGGGVTNPANALAQIISAMHDELGRVQIPHFYDDVVPLSDREREQFAALAFDEVAFMNQIGVDGVTGEEGYSTLARRWARPTLDIHGLTSGYQGEGPKTIIPGRAQAKFSCRLVPNQDPAKITEDLRALLARLCPPGIQWELVEMQGSAGIVVPLDSHYMEAASAAIEQGFGKRPVFIREGGSIPIVNSFRDQLGADTLLLGWGQNDDNTHGPNEKFSLEDYYQGTLSSAFLWHELGQLDLS